MIGCAIALDTQEEFSSITRIPNGQVNKESANAHLRDDFVARCFQTFFHEHFKVAVRLAPNTFTGF